MAGRPSSTAADLDLCRGPVGARSGGHRSTPRFRFRVENDEQPAILAKAKAGQFMWLHHGRQQTSTCHVHNLAQAVEHALTRGEGGHACFIADADRGTLRDFFTPLA